MGRGRQKAKQTKVARQLKYFSPNTDYDALQRELTTADGHVYPPAPEAVDEVDEVEDDEADDDEDDEYADWSPGQHR